jgi:hypothetical protein
LKRGLLIPKQTPTTHPPLKYKTNTKKKKKKQKERKKDRGKD